MARLLPILIILGVVLVVFLVSQGKSLRRRGYLYVITVENNEVTFREFYVHAVVMRDLSIPEEELPAEVVPTDLYLPDGSAGRLSKQVIADEASVFSGRIWYFTRTRGNLLDGYRYNAYEVSGSFVFCDDRLTHAERAQIAREQLGQNS